MGKFKVIDVSYWNGDLSVSNYKKLKKKGIQAVIVRCGYCINGVDSKFNDNVKNAKAAGLKVGAYWYGCAQNLEQARKEANAAIKLCKGKGLTYPLFYDVEDSDTMGKLSDAGLTKVINEFCSTVKDAGLKTGVYASYSWFANKINDVKWDIWVAQYNETCSYKGKKAGWQYSSSYTINGIKHKFDVSWFYKDYADKKVTIAKTAYKGELVLPKRGYFKKGDKGEKVKQLQKALNWDGHSLYVDGVLGEKTVSAVESFEKKHDLKVDGVFGKRCLAKFKTIKH